MQQEILAMLARLLWLFLYLLSCFCLLRFLIPRILRRRSLPVTHRVGGYGQALDLKEAKIDLAGNAVDEGEGGLHRVIRYGDLTCPLIEGAARDIADDTFAPGVHDAIDDGVERAVAAIADYQLMSVLRGLLGQFQGLSTEFLQAYIGLPPCRLQDGNQIWYFDNIVTRTQIDDQAGAFSMHSIHLTDYKKNCSYEANTNCNAVEFQRPPSPAPFLSLRKLFFSPTIYICAGETCHCRAVKPWPQCVMRSAAKNPPSP